MGGRREIQARKRWRPKRGGRLKRGGKPEGSRGQKKVEVKMGWEDHKGWEAGEKERPGKKWSLKCGGRLKRGGRLEGSRG